MPGRRYIRTVRIETVPTAGDDGPSADQNPAPLVPEPHDRRVCSKAQNAQDGGPSRGRPAARRFAATWDHSMKNWGLRKPVLFVSDWEDHHCSWQRTKQPQCETAGSADTSTRFSIRGPFFPPPWRRGESAATYFDIMGKRGKGGQQCRPARPCPQNPPALATAVPPPAPPRAGALGFGIYVRGSIFIHARRWHPDVRSTPRGGVAWCATAPARRGGSPCQRAASFADDTRPCAHRRVPTGVCCHPWGIMPSTDETSWSELAKCYIFLPRLRLKCMSIS